MNSTVAFAVGVTRSVLFGAELPAVPDGFSWAELYSFARIQCMENLIFAGVQDLLQAAEPVLAEEWSACCEMNLIQSINQMDALDEIKEVFTRENIPYIPLKGWLMKGLYPQEDFRQMSDLDCLIHEEDAARARAVMEQLDYETEQYGLCKDDQYFREPYVKVELHRKLFEAENDPSGYYETAPCWRRLVHQAGTAEVHFSPEDFYLQMVMHFYGHYSHSGCGLRPVLDLVFYRRAVCLDEAYLQQQYRALGIEKFIYTAEQLGDCLASKDVVLPDGKPGSMLEYLTGNSMYGDRSTHMDNTMQQLKEKYKNPLLVRFMYIVVRLCPPVDRTSWRYPILKKYPFLLPFCWIHRLFYALFVDKILGSEMKIYKNAQEKL